MIISSTPPDSKRVQNSDAEGNDHLRLNPGEPERKPRSVGKLCVWLTILIVGLVGSIAVYFFITGVIYNLRHPHSNMYYDKPEAQISDWSTVVQPLVKKEDPFDIVASVWIRDDEGKDGVINIDGEERPERLIYSGTIFRDLTYKSKHKFANVNLRVPTSHFKQPNISNYDLRASFVLVQPQHPPWVDKVHNLTSWKPKSLHSPSMRPLGHNPGLVDEIYDSFGITIPLIQFHDIAGGNATSEKVATEAPELDVFDDTEEEEEFATEAELEKKHERAAQNMLDIHTLEFMGARTPEHHPLIVTRTHLTIVDETHTYKRKPYMFAQKELADKTCEHHSNPLWYQCKRNVYQNGVFETRVHISGRSETPASKKSRNRSFEYLYAPHMSALGQSAGPKDLIAVPAGGEAATEGMKLTSDEEYMNVTWRLSFMATKPGNHLFQAWISALSNFNLSASDNELTYAQHRHDSTLGLFGYRIDENAHPRRSHLIGFISSIIRAFCWFMTIHYWYTRTSTTGISRFGTALVACYLIIDANQAMLMSVFSPKGKGHWLSRIPMSYVFLLIPPFVMLKAVSRLEFSSKTGKETEKRRVSRVYLAKATHLERASERIEARVSWRKKVLFLVLLFGIAHFFAGPYAYFITPRVPPPAPTPHPIHSLSNRIPAILQHVYSLSLTLELGGTIFQFIMNGCSKTYAGRYKVVTFLLLVANALLFLDLLPHVVGTSARIGGILVREGLGLVVSAVDFVQATRYKSAKAAETDAAEE